MSLARRTDRLKAGAKPSSHCHFDLQEFATLQWLKGGAHRNKSSPLSTSSLNVTNLYIVSGISSAGNIRIDRLHEANLKWPSITAAGIKLDSMLQYVTRTARMVSERTILNWINFLSLTSRNLS
jgi:hypothetical protein